MKFKKDDFFLTCMSDNFVLLSKRSVNHGFEVAVDIPVHDFLQCFTIGLVNRAGLTSGL